MVVCRFFLEGRCRFGERCYNEHVSPSENAGRFSNQRNSGRYSSPQQRQQSEYYYESPKYRDQPRYDSPDNRYAKNYANSPDRYQRQQNYQESPNPYQWRSSKYNESHGNDQQTFNAQSSASKNSFNVLGNLDDNSSGHHDYSNRSRRQQYEQSSQKSFQNSSNFFKAPNDRQLDHTGDASLGVREDMVIWEEGQQWPFSCYSPGKNALIPELEDVSPEELRYQAYEAEKTNTFPIYVQSVTEALEKVKKTREMLKHPTLEVSALINQVVSNAAEPKVQVSSKEFSFNKALGSSQTSSATSVFFGKPAASSVFSLGNLSPSKPAINEVESMNEDLSAYAPSASPMRFVDPGHASRVAETTQESSMYTLMESLTEDEKSEFSSATFTLGKIPTRPPPKIMCF